MCSSNGYYLKAKNATMVGMYCSGCGKWVKWVGKKDMNAAVRSAKGKRILGIAEPLVLEQQKHIEKNPTENHFIGRTITEGNIEHIGFAIDEEAPFETDTPKSRGQYGSDLGVEKESSSSDKLEIQELKRRISELESMQSTQENSNSGCEFCDGTSLISTDNSLVDVCVLDGVMMVTDTEGIKVLGVYRVDKCPICGKDFKRGVAVE